MMTTGLVLSVLILCISLDYAQPTAVEDEHPWDLLIFTQQWPVTVCKEWKDHDHSHTCAMPKKQDSWTIHGIWPTKLGSMGPAFCNKTWHFDPEEIRSIETPLIESWTNIEAGTTIYGLWAHEWDKHGTCAAVLEPLNAQIKYFTKGLEFLNKYTMTDILKEADIVPSNDKEYPIADIYNAVKVRLGVNPVIECRKEEGRNWLVEIRICFNKTLDLTDCDGVLGADRKFVMGLDFTTNTVLTNCDPYQGIVYPLNSAPAMTLYVELYKLVSWLLWFTL